MRKFDRKEILDWVAMDEFGGLRYDELNDEDKAFVEWIAFGKKKGA